MSGKCDKFGCNFIVEEQDEDFNYEVCIDCGKKKRFVKHKKKEHDYAKEHRRDILQPNQRGFEECYPETVKEKKKLAKQDKQEEEEIQENLEKGIWEEKRAESSSPFVGV